MQCCDQAQMSQTNKQTNKQTNQWTAIIPVAAHAPQVTTTILCGRPCASSIISLSRI